MDTAEIRFRAAAAVRGQVERARTALTPETWRRESLRMAAGVVPGEAEAALGRGDWTAAHAALARHFATRESPFPLDPRRLPDLARVVARAFGREPAVARAEAIVGGRYDLLGYRDVEIQSPPDWHQDPVHRRRAPLLFWRAVPYLNPAFGDHKVTWELNRHQHFLVLGRAYALSGDARYYEEFVRHLTHWIRTNPPLVGTNWASMLELGFRSLSWLWALHFFAGAASAADREPWIVDLLMALDRQLAHVEQNLSRYFSPNTHLTGEALALYVAGCALPELAASAGRRQVGGAILREEAHRQILADGGHAERSAHYHRYSTDFYLLAFNVARKVNDPAAAEFAEASRRQVRFLRALADDRGRLPLLGDDDGGQLFPICRRPAVDARDTFGTAAVLLNDSALLIGAVPEETYWLCGTTSRAPLTSRQSSPPSSTGFPETGYYISRRGSGDHLVFDAGPHGFLNGGHAHADALSIHVTAGNRPLLVDAGTATYTMNPEMRNRFRSTAMHNTVVVNRRSQAEPRGPFHWKRVRDAWCAIWQPGAVADYVEGAHDAYAPVVHARAVICFHGQGWIVVDHLLSDGKRASASAMWHVHPDWALRRSRARSLHLGHAEGAIAAISASTPLRQMAASGLDEHAPEYGRVETGLCFAAETVARTPFSFCTWISPGGEMGAVSALDLSGTPGADRHGAAFRIDALEASFVVLSSVELAITADTVPSYRGRLWGTQDYQTTGRAALLQLTPSGPHEIWTLDSPVAPSVHPGNTRGA